MDSNVKKIACVTGASSGIGYATAKELATLGYDIIAVARRMDRLKELEEDLNQNPETSDCRVFLANWMSAIKWMCSRFTMLCLRIGKPLMYW